MGPFREDVVRGLEKIKDLDIKVIATGHGPVVVKNPQEIINLYREWSAPPAHYLKKTVIIPYVTAYGFTKMLADKIAEGIRSVGDIDVILPDMVYDDLELVMSEFQKADGILLGTPTIVGDALPPIWNVAASINGRIHGGKFASAFGSYGWSGEGVTNIMGRLRQTGLKIYGDGLRFRFKPSKVELEKAFEYGCGFGRSVLEGKIVDEGESEN